MPEVKDSDLWVYDPKNSKSNEYQRPTQAQIDEARTRQATRRLLKTKLEEMEREECNPHVWYDRRGYTYDDRICIRCGRGLETI